MRKEKKHILVVSQYFHPEQFRINDICTEWVKRGYKVTVLTGIPNYPQGKFYEGYDLNHNRTEEWNGVKIIRIPLVARGNNAIGLAMNYMSFVMSGFIWNTFTKIRADIVFNYEVSPMTQVLVGVWYAKKNHIPCYLYVTDLWPDNVEIVSGIHNKQFLGAINRMVNYIYRHCEKIFTSSESFIEKLAERGVPRNKLAFWPQYAEDFYVPCEGNGDKDLNAVTGIPSDGIFNIVFAGNIGYAQGLGVLIEAAELLKIKKIPVRFNIIGDGRYKKEMMEKVQLKQVVQFFHFIGRQPAADIPKFLAAGDAALICLAKSEVFSMTIPAKTQSCLACGMPIIVSADGEIRRIVEKAECGYTSPSGDSKMLAENIIKIVSLDKTQIAAMGQRALHYYRSNFDKAELMDAMDRYLQ